MIVRRLAEIEDSERDVEGPTFHSRRLLLARDGTGFSFHDTVLFAGTETQMEYRHHVEAVYCIDGEGELIDHDEDVTHAVGPGTMYCLDAHDRHTLRARTDLRMICVFDPPLTGEEVHDEEGVYPLLLTDEELEQLGKSPGAGDRPRATMSDTRQPQPEPKSPEPESKEA